MIPFAMNEFTLDEFTLGAFTMRELGVDVEPEFAMIWNGSLGEYTIYTRNGIAYAEDQSGSYVEVAQDVLPYEYVNGVKVARFYAGTNKCECDGIPTSITTGITKLGDTAATLSIITHTDGLKYYYLDNTLGSSFAYCTVAGATGNTNKHSCSIYGFSAGTSSIFIGSASQGDVIVGTTPDVYGVSNITPLGAGAPLTVFCPAGSWMAWRLPQMTETTYQLPTIPASKDGATTVNPSTTSILAEDIDTASFLFDNILLDSIDLSRPSDLDFTPQTDAFEIEGWFRTSNATTGGTLYSFGAPTTTTDRQIHLFVRSAGTIRIIIGGEQTTSSATFNDGESHFFKMVIPASASGPKVYVDDVLIISGGSIGSSTSSENGYYGARTDGLSFNFDGYLWDWKHYSGNGSSRVLVAHHKMSEYRKDTFVRGELGNNGTASRSIDNLISENDAFGYAVGEKAPTPFVYTTDDGVTVQKGLRELFGGDARGSDLASNYDFTTWIPNQGAKNITKNSFDSDTGGAGVYTAIFEAGEEYELYAQGTIEGAGNIEFRDAGLTTFYGAGFGTHRFVAVHANLYLKASSAAVDNDTYTITTLVVRKVSPAIFSVPFTSYIPHGLTEDLPLLQFTTDDFIPLYVEQTTGLIKAYDGTNTAISASAAVAGSEVSGWWSCDGSKMWVTIGGVKGVEVDFAGLPDIGARVFGLTAETYQTIKELYFLDELAVEDVPLGSSTLTSGGTVLTSGGIEITSEGTTLYSTP